jgi:hypothetical protein
VAGLGVVPRWPDLECTTPARSGTGVAGSGAHHTGSEGTVEGPEVALGTLVGHWSPVGGRQGGVVGGRRGSPVGGRRGGVVDGDRRLQRHWVERSERRHGLVAAVAAQLGGGSSLSWRVGRSGGGGGWTGTGGKCGPDWARMWIIFT